MKPELWLLIDEDDTLWLCASPTCKRVLIPEGCSPEVKAFFIGLGARVVTIEDDPQ